MQQGQRPLGVGVFFSLGHSTVVVVATALIAATALRGAGTFFALPRNRRVDRHVSVSALFLFAIAR